MQIKNKAQDHNRRIVEQFSRQAVPFARKIAAHSSEEALWLIVKTLAIRRSDNVLDVACGPGLLTTFVARSAGHVTGIDLVPAMIREARRLQREKGLSNMTWRQGDVTRLPFADGTFSATLTRFSFHHFLKPQVVLKEMIRVTRPGGRVGVVDVFTVSPAHSRLHNRVESLRDDSHVKALSLDRLKRMAVRFGLKDVVAPCYLLEIGLESQLAASFPVPGGAEEIRRIIARDNLGLISCRKGDGVYLFYPVAVVVGRV